MQRGGTKKETRMRPRRLKVKTRREQRQSWNILSGLCGLRPEISEQIEKVWKQSYISRCHPGFRYFKLNVPWWAKRVHCYPQKSVSAVTTWALSVTESRSFERRTGASGGVSPATLHASETADCCSWFVDTDWSLKESSLSPPAPHLSTPCTGR